MNLLEIIGEEESVWSVVYSHELLLDGKVRAYWYPPYPKHPHWNIAYPQFPDFGDFSSTELKTLLHFYQAKKCQGHLLDQSLRHRSHQVSEDDYLFRPYNNNLSVIAHPYEVEDTNNHLLFSEIVQKAFGFDDAIRHVFAAKMFALSQALTSKFYLLRLNSEIIGCWSAFETSGGYEFLMNGGLLPAFRGRGHSQLLVAAMVAASRKPLLTHTNHDAFRDHLLPNAGFKSAGKVNVLPLDLLQKAAH